MEKLCFQRCKAVKLPPIAPLMGTLIAAESKAYKPYKGEST